MLNKLVNQAVLSHPEYKASVHVIEKEILHHDILSVMLKHNVLNDLTFIGGTALRLCYNSVRLSEDIDFTVNRDTQLQDLRGFGDEIAKFIKQKYGMNVTVKEPVISKDDTSTWKVSIEKEASRPDMPRQKINIDICSVHSLGCEHRPLIDHYDVCKSSFLIPVQSQSEILADKFVALALNNIKPRDLWDITWLQNKGIKLNSKNVTDKLALRNIDTSYFEALMKQKLLMVKSHPDVRSNFTKEMERFLPNDVAKNTIRNEEFWGYLKGEVDTQATNLLSNINSPKKNKPFDMGT